MNHKTLLASVAAIAIYGTGCSAFAQEAPNELEPVVVTADRKPTDANKVGSKVEIVDKQEIDEKSAPMVTDYLNLLPGVSISNGGGAGADTTLIMRGLPGRYVKTLFNGIDIADPTNTQVQTQYQYLQTGGIDNIEVLKGSQGTMYGSEAIAGVIGISTLGGIPVGLHHEVDLEGGSYGTVRGRYGLKAATEASRVALNVTGFRNDGFSSAAGGEEHDGFRNAGVDAAFESRFNDHFSVFGAAFYTDAKAEFDDSSPVADNPFNWTTNKQKAVRGGVNFDLLDGRSKNTVSAQAYGVDRDILTVSQFGPFEGAFKGTRQKVDYQGSFEAAQWLTLQYGADLERQRAHATDNYGTNTDEAFSNSGVWGQVGLTPVEGLSLTGSARHDEHSEFGGFNTYRATGSYLFAQTGTRLHGSYGTGFRAPSLYELFAPFAGNPTLQPEQSRSFDVGIEQRLLDERLLVDVTYFNLNVDNLILYDYSTYAYVQSEGVTKSRGVEASFTYDVNGWLGLGGSYTYTKAETEDGARAARVPTHAFVLSSTVRPAERWEIGADLKYVADVVDIMEQPLDDYVLVNAKISYKPNENTEVYVRGENLLDQDYQTVKGYNTSGIAGFAGVKLKF